jgi:hypothetical protein
LKSKLAELNQNMPPMKWIVEGPIRGCEAQGYLGQFLVVVPKDHVVAVRQRRGPGGSDSSKEIKRSFTDAPCQIPDPPGAARNEPGVAIQIEGAHTLGMPRKLPEYSVAPGIPERDHHVGASNQRTAAIRKPGDVVKSSGKNMLSQFLPGREVPHRSCVVGIPIAT